MRDEMLKRLDEIIRYAVRSMEEEYRPEETEAEWLALRAELVAERCENCRHWQVTPSDSNAAPCMKSGAYLYQVATVYSYCCPHFTKKEPLP